jgi:hypothetical protein
MKEIATIKFYDIASSDEGAAIVRCDEEYIALCLSLKLGGDVEIVMNKTDTQKIIDALVQATKYCTQ